MPRAAVLLLAVAACGSRAGPAPSDEPATCATARCVVPAAVTGWACGDGSEAGPTGRCVADDSGCAWEIRLCPGEAPPCVPGGCGLQACVELGDDAPTACRDDERDECASYGTCARQPDGACGWTVTPRVRACRKWTVPGEP